jgi:2-polyprenyl-3-methyl-5-hydroxy-6-metoxy-1,4-benzoquinol methylase
VSDKDPRLITPALPKLFVGVVTYRYIEQLTVQSLFNEIAHLPFPGTLVTYTSANVWKGRNYVVKMFLDSDADYLLFVDADMQIPRGATQAIVEAIKEHPDAGIMGGFYTSRDPSMRPLVGWLNEEGNDQIPAEEAVKKLLECRGEIVEADLIPTGFMLIKRSVFEDMPFPWFLVEMVEKPSGELVERSSDNVFVRKTRELGYKTYAHLGIELGHVGSMTYVPEMLYRELAMFDAQQQLREQKQVFIDQYGVNTKEYWDSLYSMEAALGKVRQYPILHETVCAAVNKDWRVLDLGSGPGVLAEKLKGRVKEVVCKDLSSFAVDTCKNKGFEAEQFDVVNDKVPNNEMGTYDCVIMTEVLEHIEDPAPVIKKIYSFLRKGGLALISVPDDRLPPEIEPEHVTTYTAAKLGQQMVPFEEVMVEPVAGYLVAVGIKPKKPKKEI